MDINEATAKALQAARAVSGLTFDELAKESGIPRPTVYRMFGAKRDIKLPQLYAVAQAMGVTVVEIMQDAERIQRRSERHGLAEPPSARNTLADGEVSSAVPDMSEWTTDEQADYIAKHLDQFDFAAKYGDTEREQEAFEEQP